MIGSWGTRAGRERQSAEKIVCQHGWAEEKGDAAAPTDVRAFCSQTPTEKTPMTRDDALKQLRHIGQERAFGRHVGSDRLIQAGLDALIAEVESPSLAMLAGLLRSEEPEAPALFDPSGGDAAGQPAFTFTARSNEDQRWRQDR